MGVKSFMDNFNKLGIIFTGSFDGRAGNFEGEVKVGQDGCFYIWLQPDPSIVGEWKEITRDEASYMGIDRVEGDGLSNIQDDNVYNSKKSCTLSKLLYYEAG